MKRKYLATPIIGLLVISAFGTGSADVRMLAFSFPITQTRSACNLSPVGSQVSCYAVYRTDQLGSPAPQTVSHLQFLALPTRPLPSPPIAQTPPPLPESPAPPQGAITPAILAAAYRIQEPVLHAGVGQTIAIVDAFDDPSAEPDMFAYRNHFHIKECVHSSKPPCFQKIDQNGYDLTLDTAIPPAPLFGWAFEISVDLDMVSAICPNCRIILVEAKDDSMQNLDAAVNTAARFGANVISISWGQASDAQAEDPTYQKNGIVIVAAGGDSGYGPVVPASYSHVVAVGGTTLLQAPPTTYLETVWNLTGGGCSHVPKPRWQDDARLPGGLPGCENRTVNDISAIGDPNTPVAVYDTFQTSNETSNGWMQAGGTSVAAPIIAGVFALAGMTKYQVGAKGLWEDKGIHTNHIFGGGNAVAGATCPEPYLCTGANSGDQFGRIYNGPGGWGSPNGLRGFSRKYVPVGVAKPKDPAQSPRPANTP